MAENETLLIENKKLLNRKKEIKTVTWHLQIK